MTENRTAPTPTPCHVLRCLAPAVWAVITSDKGRTTTTGHHYCGRHAAQRVETMALPGRRVQSGRPRGRGGRTMNATTCPAWCQVDYLDSDGVTVHRHETSDPDAPYLVRVEQYPDAAPGVYIQDANGDDLTPEEALAMADALVRAARLVEGES